MSGDGFNILLIEDSRTQAVRLESLLAEHGWNVRWASSGEDALEALGEFVPDLILSDYHLPGMRGDGVCRELRMRIDTRVIAIMMLTADHAPEIEARALESGADDFLRKSADPDLLVLRASTLMKRSRMHNKILDPAESKIRRTRILAVDDSPTYLAHLASELQGEAYELETMDNPVAAFDRIAQGEFDCVLVDLVMPEMSGVDLCRRTKEIADSGRPAPMTLMLTAMDDREDLTRALDAGADDFVGKSSDATVLKVRIRALLRRRFYEEENTRILAELKDKQIQIERTRMEKEAAEARAMLVEKLKQTAAGLRETNAELERFAYVASHDLQEPLRMVASYLQLLESQSSERLDEKGRECVAYAINGARRLKLLIGDLLAYSRIRTQGTPFLPADTGEIFDHIAERFRSEHHELELTRGDMPKIEADAEQVGMLFRHLLENAVKFRAAESPRIHVEATEREDDWLFKVTDNGIGIAQQYADRVFIIFQRLHTQDAYPGTGAGLAICKRIVERHDGQIWLEPSEGAGATICFTLAKSPDVPQEALDHAA